MSSNIFAGTNSVPPCRAEADRRLRSVVILVAAIWSAGFLGHFTPLTEWPALFIYVIGGLSLTLAHCQREQAWAAVGMESILVDQRLILLFPVLVLAEEFLWRDMARCTLRDRGWNMHLAVVAPIKV